MNYEGSLPPRTRLRDGSRLIYCKRCSRLVGVLGGMANFGSVDVCAICDAADRGEVLPAETLEALNSSPIPGIGLVPKNVVFSVDQQNEAAKVTDPLTKGEASAVLGPRYWLRAATIAVKKTLKERLVGKDIPASQKLAIQKRRKPIFSRSLEEEMKDE